MLDSPSDNVKLDFEQLQKIDIAQKRLSNIQNETVLANKTLFETRGSLQMVSKEKEYQEELLNDLTSKTITAKSDYENLLVKIQETSELLSINTQKSREVSIANDIKHAELLDWEERLSNRESEHGKTVDNFNINSSKLEEEKVLLKKAKESFEEALKTVVW